MNTKKKKTIQKCSAEIIIEIEGACYHDTTSKDFDCDKEKGHSGDHASSSMAGATEDRRRKGQQVNFVISWKRF